MRHTIQAPGCARSVRQVPAAIELIELRRRQDAAQQVFGAPIRLAPPTRSTTAEMSMNDTAMAGISKPAYMLRSTLLRTVGRRLLTLCSASGLSKP